MLNLFYTDACFDTQIFFGFTVFEAMIEQIQIYQKNYPMTMRRVFVINGMRI